MSMQNIFKLAFNERISLTLSKVIYNTKATAVGGREGHVHSEDGAVDMTLVVPRAMRG